MKSRAPRKMRGVWQSSCTDRPVRLSPRQQEVLRYVAAGHTTKELAAALNIAPSTAEWHISNILLELGAASRAEAVAIGLREGLIEPGERPLPGTSATDSATRGAHRARPSREGEVINFDVLGLPLGTIRIERGREIMRRRKTKPLGHEPS